MVKADRKDSATRQHIVQSAAEMVRELGSDRFRIVDVAKRANVGVPTIYYHFDSRTHLIAEAQILNYFEIVEPHHRVLSQVESALVAGDETAYWAAVEENMILAWSSGQIDRKMGIMKLLLDVWSDPKTHRRFSDLLDIQFARWIAVVDGAQRVGWIAQDIDARTLIAAIWSASVGQVITANSDYLELSPEDFRDFYIKILRGASQCETTVVA